MERLTFADVRNRVRILSSLKDGTVIRECTGSLLNSNNPDMIASVIRQSVIENYNVPFGFYADLFDEVVRIGNVSQVESLGDYIVTEVVKRTRSAKETNTLIKRRMGNLKRKLTGKLSKKFSVDSHKTKKPKSPVNTSSKSIKKSAPSNESVALECYERMLIESNKNIHSDRIIENYNRISKRFNLDMTFTENTKINGVQDTVLEICRRIDTYDMPDFVKFNTIIETCWYGFESNNINYKKSDILEMAIDYFCFKPDGLKACKDILEASAIFDKDEDLVDKGILAEDEDPDTTDQEPDDVKDNDPTVYDNTIQEGIDKYCGIVKEDGNEENKDNTEDTKFNQMFKQFKKEEAAKTEDNSWGAKLRGLVSKLYSRSVDGVIKGTPKLLFWIRSFFILGSAAIPVVGPVIMIVGFIADRFLSLHFERKETQQMIDCFKKEIKECKAKLSTLKDNEEKEKMKKYIKSLEDAKEKIESNLDELLTDEEQSERYDNMFDDDDSGDDSDYESDGDDDFNFDDDDFDFDDDFLEAANSMEKYTNLVNTNPINEFDMMHIVDNIGAEDIMNIAQISAEYPDVFHKDSVLKAIENGIRSYSLNNIKSESGSIDIDKVIKLTEYKSAKELLISTKPIPQPITINEVNDYMTRLSNVYEAVTIMNNAIQYKGNEMLEASFMNSLKMASMKLKDAMKNLKDKAKSIAQTVDMTTKRFKDNVEKALTDKNRENILKGSILPSASKLITLGIINAGLVIIGQPVLAVIGTLGYLGVQTRFKAKERQALIDEIEIELKMCEKYIDIAESKNDMVALKQLLKMQRELQRQLQRIKYKLKVSPSSKAYKPEDVNIDGKF